MTTTEAEALRDEAAAIEARRPDVFTSPSGFASSSANFTFPEGTAKAEPWDGGQVRLTVVCGQSGQVVVLYVPGVLARRIGAEMFVAAADTVGKR